MKALAKEFVLVRLTNAKLYDLTLFQFDGDLSWAVFFLTPDKTVLGRYGSRSDRFEAQRDVSIQGLTKAMEQALAWHKDKEVHRSLQAKRLKETEFKTMLDFPKEVLPTKSCFHCHNIRTAEQLTFRIKGEPVPEKVLFSWPMPDAVGLNLDPNEMTTVMKVWKDSIAERSGFKVGDRITSLNSQPLLSIADVQWVLQNAGEEEVLNATVVRGSEKQQIKLSLEPGWRRYSDISWRSTTSVLRETFLYGIQFRDLSAEDRKKHGLSNEVVALTAARGVSRDSELPIRRGDIIVAVEGNDDFMTEGDLIAFVAQKTIRGQKYNVTVLRDGKKIAVELIAP